MRVLAGRTLLVVGAFGVAMVVFGLSRSFWLSIVALAVSGGVDMASMVLRSTILAARRRRTSCAAG